MELSIYIIDSASGNWIFGVYYAFGGLELGICDIRERNILVLKTLRERLERTIFASGRFGPLQMVSEADTRRCASGRLSPEGGWTRGGVTTRSLGPEEGWIVRSHISWGGK